MTGKWVGIVSAVCFIACYVPQLTRTYRTRNVDGISTLCWIIIVTGYASGLFYIAPLKDPLLTATYGIGGACAVAMLAACLLFRKS